LNLIYDNEVIRFGKDFPSLVRSFQSDPAKPLVVFFPGWAHLGRISYGYPDCNEEHFLAHWIIKRGYPFLATSYPISHPIYAKLYPEFSLTDWGEMAAEITTQVIEEGRLNKEVIGISWSAAGQVIRPYNVACKSLGIKVLFHLGLESSPALIIPSDRTSGMKTTTKGLVSLEESHYNLFWREIDEQNRLNAGVLIPKETYFKDFLGDIPVGLIGTNERFEHGQIVTDIEKSLEDKDFFAFKDYPLIASISGESSLAPYHPFVDKWTWGFLTVRKIYHDFINRNEDKLSKFSNSKFKELVDFVNELPDRLHKSIPGNHFLFLGKKGAKQVAEHVEHFDKEIALIKRELKSLFS